jgi:hypothetical protein
MNSKTFSTEERLNLLERRKWQKRWCPLNLILIVLLLGEWGTLIVIGPDDITSFFVISGVIYAPIWALITGSLNRWGLLSVFLALIPLIFFTGYDPWI